MKHILIVTLVLMSFISSPSWSETMNDLVQREDTFYRKFTDVPFTGQVEGQYQGALKNGLREGSWVTYHDNGQLLEKGDYKNGRHDGSWMGYFDDGSVITPLTGTYKDGVKISD
jgi:antitoxin component YwqK of YwqJK toxin-antitoxin module